MVASLQQASELHERIAELYEQQGRGEEARADQLQADRPDPIEDPRPGRPQRRAHPEPELVHETQGGEGMGQLASAGDDQEPVALL
jgi:hypothetical protein